MDGYTKICKTIGAKILKVPLGQINVFPIGNHHLDRHQVYKLKCGTKKIVLKIYYKTNRRCREISSHQILKGSHSIRMPSILGKGILEDGKEWLSFSYVKGTLLNMVWRNLSEEELKNVFFQMGTQLAHIHSAKTFDFFGDWDDKGRSLHNFNGFYDWFVRRQEAHIKSLSRFDLPEKKLLDNVIKKVRCGYSYVNNIKTARLCHGDFDGRNILVNKENEKWMVSGIIDFEQSHPSYIGLDMMGLYSQYFIDFPVLSSTFFSAYEQILPIDPLFFQLKDYLLLCYGLSVCSWTYEKVKPYYNEGIALLTKLQS